MVTNGKQAPRVALIVGAVLTVVIVGAVVARSGGSGSGQRTQAEVEDPGGTGPVEPGAAHRAESGRSDSLDVAGGDESSAVSAALDYATAPQRWLYLTDLELEVEVRAIATSDAADRLVAEVVGDVGRARERLHGSSGRVWWLVRPLAWQVDHHRPDTARVSVWTVTILSATDVAAPQSEFATVTLHLKWADGAWRVDDVLDRPGPTPMTGPMDQPWDAVPFDEALAGFTRVGEAPDP